MLKQAHKDRLKELGINVEELEKAIKDDKEVDVVLPEGELLTNDQLTTRDKVKTEDGEKEGKKKAVEVAKVEIKKHAGIEIKGDRWGDIGTELKAVMNATNDDKIKTLTEQNQLLIADNSKLTGEAATIKSTYESKIGEIEVMSKLPGIPQGLKSLQETHELMKLRGYSTEKTDKGYAWKKDGEFIKDKTTHEPLVNEAATKFIWETEKWNTPAQQTSGGRGAGQRASGEAAGAIMNKTQAAAAWTELHPDKNINTPEGMAFYEECAKTPNFNMYE